MERDILLKGLNDCSKAIDYLKSPPALLFMQNASSLLIESFLKGGKVLLAGNGGSLADAIHFSEELTGFFRKARAPLPALVISDPSYLTCTANDLGFEWVFSRAIEAYGKEEDVFIGLTTSGKSLNIIKAFEKAKEKKIKTISFLGKGGGFLKGIADLELLMEETLLTSDRIQEAHMTAMHLIIELIEKHLFPDKSS